MSTTNSPSGEVDSFPIVGIGASAGGLAAFEKFFAAMPANSDMAFVLVQHLDPTHESLTAHLLSRYTQMPVIEAEDGMPVEVNSLYIIPPNRYLAIGDNTLQLSEPKLQRGMRMPIDFFLRSLAQAQREKAIAIILSGTGSDGTLGVRAVKGEGGIALAQSPETAQYDGMPRSAITTGLVDYVGSIESMPEVLLRYNRHAFVNQTPEPAAEAPDLLRSILSVLQAHTKYDFRCYKKGTLLRRITRRMGLNQIETLRDYLAFLRGNPEEPTQLFRDLLIGVTGFFREAPAFDALEHVIAKLIEGKGAEQAIRIWVPGCASGEEPYSIAMLVSEQLQAAQKDCPIQIFATDIDQAALATARAGLYPENIAADVAPERLQRFFRREGNSYRVSKSIRDSVVFAVQNLISDPPFSKLDLVSCRNLLIYLEPEFQKKVIGLFHFSLNVEGYLLLGGAETAGQQEDLFEPVVKKWRLYRRVGAARRNVVEFPIFPGRSEHGIGAAAERPLLSDPARLGDFTREVLLKTFVPASVLVDRKLQILYYHGATARYMEQPAGPPHEDLLRKAREGLRIKLRGLLHKVVHERGGVASGIAELHDDHQTRRIRISVTPVSVPGQTEGLLLVSFQDEALAPQAAATLDDSPSGGDGVVQQLERELQATRDDLQSTIEEMESSNEELKAANEEVMSVNEELQSTNEELETSKEELQSLNEELSTVNSQLEEKVHELEATNDDLDNLLSSTDLATLFLDRTLRIKRFTPATSRLFNVIATDRGRPVSDISRKFEDPDLLADAALVVERLVPIEKDVTTTDGERWFTRRILPYRTQDDRIQGVVVTFVDVTERKRAVQWFRLIVHAAPNAAVVVNGKGQIEFVNTKTTEYFGYAEEEMMGKAVEILVPERFRERHPGFCQSYFSNPEPRAMGDGRELFGRRQDGREFPVEVGLNPVQTDWGTYVLATIIDITERWKAAQELREAKDQADRANQAKSLFLASVSHDLRQPLQTLTLLNGVLGRKVQDADVLEVVNKQNIALASMSHLLRLFLDLSETDTGSIKPQITDIAMNDLLDGIKDEFFPIAQANNLALHVMPCSVAVRSDAGLLSRILQNLVANAIKFTAVGRVLVGCRRRGETLRIEVWDTGPGIPTEHVEDIFDEFVQLNNPGRQSFKGYGVGLAVVKQLAQLLGHRLDVRSMLGKGSMFAVDVPVTRSAGTTPPAPADTPFVPYEGKPGAAVLVIEDDPEVLAAMRTVLESLGLKVTTASSDVEALANLKAGGAPCDLIIADYRLAELDSGIDVIRHILDALERRIPAMLLSGATLPASVHEMEASGYAVLQKPVVVDQLVAKINQLLRV